MNKLSNYYSAKAPKKCSDRYETWTGRYVQKKKTKQWYVEFIFAQSDNNIKVPTKKKYLMIW